jgi:hypothetical protein
MQFKTKACLRIEKFLRKECVGCFFSTWRPYEPFSAVLCDISGKQKKPTDSCKKFKCSEFRKKEMHRLLLQCSPREKKELSKFIGQK